MMCSKPSQEQLKQYLQERRTSGNPPPTPEQIRRELGWALLQAEEISKRNR